MQIRLAIRSALLTLLFSVSFVFFLTGADVPTLAASTQPVWSGEFQLRFDAFRGELPLPDDGASETIKEFRRHELPERDAALGIRQLARVQAYFTPTPSSGIRFTLRNYGYWGVGYYTSGSYGIQAFTADPFSLEEYVVYFPGLNGTIAAGAQYFQFGPVGLLAATPLSEAEGIIFPVQSVVWEGDIADSNLTFIAARLRLEFDENDIPISSDELVAIRLDTESAFGQTGLNLLLSGRESERGFSVDVQAAGAYRAELALAQAAADSPWQPAVYGELIIGSQDTRLQLGYAAKGFPLLYTQMADRGGLLPLQQGHWLVGLEKVWNITDLSLAHGHLHHRISPELGHPWELNVGWSTVLGGSALLNTEWTQWIGPRPSYARMRANVQFQF